MNGKKILNELIAIFILLNIALFAFNVLKTVKSYWINQTRIDNVVYALEQKEIYLQTELPKSFLPKSGANLTNFIGSNTTTERYHIVSALFGAQNGNIIISKDSNNPDVISHKFNNETLEFSKDRVTYTNSSVIDKVLDTDISIQNAKKVCKAFIKRLNYSKVFANAHIQYNELENGLEMTFFQKYKGLPVFDTYIAFELVEGQIKKATMHLGQVGKLDNDISQRAIYPVDVVLFGIDDDLEIEKPSYITDITLGYKALNERNIALLDVQLIPVYKIKFKGLNNPIYVNAYTNKRIE